MGSKMVSLFILVIIAVVIFVVLLIFLMPKILYIAALLYHFFKKGSYKRGKFTEYNLSQFKEVKSEKIK